MVIIITEKPFKDREEVKKEIRVCGMWCNICELLLIIFVILGVIGDAFGDALNITLGLESMTWLLLAMFFAVLSIGPHIHIAVAKHLYGIESEK